MHTGYAFLVAFGGYHNEITSTGVYALNHNTLRTRMEVIFLPKPGIRLYETLMASETSRDVLRFYQPVNCGYGVSVRVSALGNGLSLASELRWYLRRYMQGALFEIHDMTYCSLAVARSIYYERSVSPDELWPWRIFYRVNGSVIRGRTFPSPEERREEYETGSGEGDRIMEVWVEEEELVYPGSLPGEEENEG